MVSRPEEGGGSYPFYILEMATIWPGLIHMMVDDISHPSLILLFSSPSHAALPHRIRSLSQIIMYICIVGMETLNEGTARISG